VFLLAITYNDVRTALLKALNDIVRAKELEQGRALLANFLRKMPAEIGAYGNPNNFHFIVGLQSADVSLKKNRL
jgi:hypothetical protein